MSRLKTEISKIRKKYRIEDIESSLVRLYLNNHNITDIKNKIIVNYLKKKPDFDLINRFSKLIGKNELKSIERIFELLIESKDRKLSGSFYTPQFIVKYIVDSVVKGDITVCDNACGSGAFLIEAVEKIHKDTNKSIISIIENNIFACDILDYAIRRTKLILSLFALAHNEDKIEIKFNIICKDSLKINWHNHFPKIFEKGGFDAIIGNPPYIRIQNLELKNREYIKSNWKTAESGNIDIYMPFIELGLSLLNSKGFLGYINPNSYFSSSAGFNLRNLLNDGHHIFKIINFDEIKVFNDVRVYSCINIFSKQRNEAIKYFKVTNNIDSILINDSDFKEVYHKNLDNNSWNFLTNEELEFVNKVENIGKKLSEISNIHVGLATLADRYYLLDYGFKKKVNDKTYNIEPESTKKIIKASLIHSEMDIQNNSKRVIWPYKKKDGKCSIIPENELKENFPNTFEYLQAIKPVLEKRDKNKQNPVSWYAYGRTQGLDSSFGKKLLTSNMNKKPNFIYCEEEDSTFFSGYSIIPHDINIIILKKILNSKVMEKYIELTSKTYQGGWKSYAKSIIGKFSIPEFSNEEENFLFNAESQEEINNFLERKYNE
ncbi:hypothetical protein B6U98_04855 [Thermoplasmatales archaeon ex4572_165]|nr:MAG: hypothetical protein B6U98_04855 [Thermoplasmatales archaeon ex4572_165]